MKTIFRDARIFTGLGHDLEAHADCLLIDDDLIEHVGKIDDAVVSEARQSGAHEVNVGGRLISPGFIDGHMHILLFGSSLLAINIENCMNLDEIRQMIRDGAQASPNAKRLLVQGWMHFMTDSKALASDLDDLDPRPIYIYAKDLHSAWCSTTALDEMGIATMSNPEGGEILRDADGKPTGLLSEAAAIGIVWPHLANVIEKEEKLSQIREAIRTYNEAGYTGAIELATDEEIWSLLTALNEQEGPFSLRIAAHWLIKPSKTTAENIKQVDRAIELHKQYNLSSSPHLRIAGIKIIGDGVVDACTASLKEPYVTPSTNADPIWSYEQLVPVVKHADAAGLQCALHAIGDQTVHNSINALAQLAESGPASKQRDRRHRIEHLELTSPEDARRLGALGITASVQPVHSDPAILRAWPELIGHERCKRAFAYGEMADGGAHLAIGTDAPTAAHLPLRNLYTATTRRSAREEQLLDTMNEEFKLGLGQAFRAATWGAAYSCFAEQKVGTLQKGMLADFIVVDLEWDAKQLLRSQVEETWFAGKRVFKKS